jgi:hypothetical protein
LTKNSLTSSAIKAAPLAGSSLGAIGAGFTRSALACAFGAGFTRSAFALVAALPLAAALACAFGAGFTRSAFALVAALPLAAALALKHFIGQPCVICDITDVIMTVICELADVIGNNVVLHSLFVAVITMTVIDIVESAMSVRSSPTPATVATSLWEALLIRTL